MIVVYWLVQPYSPRENQVRMKEFDDNELLIAIEFCESLRRARNLGASLSHIVIQSEPADMVGQPGVGKAIENTWYKRRADPAIPVGRDPHATPPWKES
jgi:hypothetical protein